MKKKTATVLIIIFGNLFVLTVGAAQVFLFPLLRSPLLFMLFAAAVLIAHTIGGKFSRRGFTRYGVSARRYILCGTLPALILCVLVNIISYIFMRYNISAFSGIYIDGLSLEWILSLFAAGYSAAFLAAQFVALAREIW